MSRSARFCTLCGAPLALQSVHGTVRPVCTACGTVVYFDPKVAVVVFILHEEQLLLVQRAMDPGRGQWALPAGFVEYDEPPAEAAIREVREETGYDVVITGLLEVFPRKDDGLANIVIAYAARLTGGTLLAADDAAAAAWFTRDALPPLAFYPSRTLAARWQRGELRP
ncbi:MAG: NUDIX hydrolase [Anaerolineae bacterium]|nr:NUDIX hydrolase [Anaerolineae bacterium]